MNHEPLDPVTDPWHLIALAQAGDRRAFGELYTIYASNIQKVLYRQCGDWHLAEDLCSETFRRALVALPALSNHGKDLGGWFGIIAKNLLRDHRELLRVQREKSVAPEEFPDGAAPEDALNTALAAERTEEISRALTQAMAQLSNQQREVLAYHYLGDRTSVETAALIGSTPGTVRVAAHKALRRLAGNTTLAKLAGRDKVTGQTLPTPTSA